jgi:Secretion system C-terminal sorting domain
LQASGTCITKDTVLVKVASAPVPAAFGGSDKTVCVSSTIALGTLPQAGYSYNWLLAPSYAYGYYLDNPNVANPNFTYYGNISPTYNSLTYIVKATKVGCVYQDTVKVFLIGASAGEDGCGPRVLGYPDPTPAIPKTFLWTVISGVGNILGANNTAQISVGAAVGGNVTYRLTVTMNGITCTDDVVVLTSCGIVNPNGCQYPTIKVLSPNACANYSTNGGNVKLVASRTISSTYSWSPAIGLSNTVGDTVSLTDNVPRTYTVTARSTIDTTNSCTSSIAVNNPVVIPVFSAQHILTCPGVPVTIGQPSVAGYTYLWEDPFGNNSLSSLIVSNPTATVNYSTYYPVKVTSTTGCIIRDTAVVTIVGFPQDIAGSDVLLCDTNVAQLGVASNPIFTYTWSGASNFIPNNTVANPKVIVNSTTTLVLLATNNATGCTVTDSVTVTVSPPIPPFSFTNVNFCQSSGAIALPQGSVGMASYSWTPSNLILNPTSNGPTATTLTAPPSYPTTFNLSVTNSGGCTKAASVLFTPTATNPVAGSNRTICKNATAQLGAGAQAGSYSWTQTPVVGGSLNSYSISNPVFTPTAVGTYKFIVSKFNAGCTTKDSVVINVTEFTLPQIASPIICQNTCVPIGTNSSTTGTQYFWNPTTGLSDATIGNPIACVTTNSLAYTLTAVGVNGCIASQNMFVTVNPSPSHTVSVPPIAACVGATGLALNTLVSPAGSYNYLWSSNIGLSNIYAANPTVSLTTVGTKNYDVTVTNNITGCATTASTTVTANACTLPIKLESFTAAPKENTVLLSWVVSQEINVLKYEIEFSSDGRIFWTIGTKAATNNTNYSLIHQSPVFGINYYRLKTIDKDGRISYSDIRTVNFKLAGSLTIYPNPANDILHITFAAGSINKSATISVIAMDGKIIYQKNIAKLSQTEILDVSKLTSGCYIIRVLTNAEVINKSVVVYK